MHQWIRKIGRRLFRNWVCKEGKRGKPQGVYRLLVHLAASHPSCPRHFVDGPIVFVSANFARYPAFGVGCLQFEDLVYAFNSSELEVFWEYF